MNEEGIVIVENKDERTFRNQLESKNFGRFTETSVFTEDSKETMITERLFQQKGFISHELWDFQELISANVLEINDSYVNCECLVSRDKNIFQIRKFSSRLFSNIKDLSVGSFVKIKISYKPGSERIDIIDGTGLGIERDFVVNEDIWEVLDQLEINKPPLR